VNGSVLEKKINKFDIYERKKSSIEEGSADKNKFSFQGEFLKLNLKLHNYQDLSTLRIYICSVQVYYALAI